MITTESYGCDKHGEDAYQGCAMCDLEALRTDYALLSDDYKQLVLDKESLRSRLADEEILLAQAVEYGSDYKQAHDEAMDNYQMTLARLAEADALLKEARDEINRLSGYAEDETDGKSGLTTWPLLDRIDAHLAREVKP
jgi:hypothetical protein